MILCEHVTDFEHFRAISQIGYIVANDRQREYGMMGHSFGSDFLAGDRRYVFFSTGQGYRSLTDEAWGFVFDAQYLVSAHNGIVGHDLMNAYDGVVHEVALEVAERLGEKPMITDAELKAFSERHGITDRNVLEAIRKDSQSHYQDILTAIWNIDESVAGGADAIKLYKERVREVQNRERVIGESAQNRLRAEQSDSDLLTCLEILIPQPLPIENAVYMGKLEASDGS